MGKCMRVRQTLRGEVSFPTATLSFSGFPFLDTAAAAAAAALSMFSQGSYSSISGLGFGQTMKSGLRCQV